MGGRAGAVRGGSTVAEVRVAAPRLGDGALDGCGASVGDFANGAESASRDLATAGGAGLDRTVLVDVEADELLEDAEAGRGAGMKPGRRTGPVATLANREVGPASLASGRVTGGALGGRVSRGRVGTFRFVAVSLDGAGCVKVACVEAAVAVGRPLPMVGRFSRPGRAVGLTTLAALLEGAGRTSWLLPNRVEGWGTTLRIGLRGLTGAAGLAGTRAAGPGSRDAGAFAGSADALVVEAIDVSAVAAGRRGRDAAEG